MSYTAAELIQIMEAAAKLGAASLRVGDFEVMLGVPPRAAAQNDVLASLEEAAGAARNWYEQQPPPATPPVDD